MRRRADSFGRAFHPLHPRTPHLHAHRAERARVPQPEGSGRTHEKAASLRADLNREIAKGLIGEKDQWTQVKV